MKAWRSLLLWTPLGILLALQLGPLALLVLTSFKTEAVLLRHGPLGLGGFFLGNYRQVLGSDGFARHMATSAVIALGSTLLAIAAGSLAAYALARLTFRGRQLFKASLLASRVIPPVALAVPVFLLLKLLHLGDTISGLVLAHTTFNLPFATWLLLPFFAALPRELEEAAALDGCTQFAAFRLIILPVAIPGLVVAGLFCFLTSWNDFLFSLVLAGAETKTAALAINGYMTGFGPEWGPMTAASMLILIPAFLLSVVLQRHMVAGLTAGGVKDG